MLNGTFYGIVFLVGVPLFLEPSVMARTDIWQKILAAKDQKEAKRVSIISGLGMVPYYIVFSLVGMSIRLVTVEEIAPRVIAYLFLDRHTGTFILPFAVVCLF